MCRFRAPITRIPFRPLRPPSASVPSPISIYLSLQLPFLLLMLPSCHLPLPPSCGSLASQLTPRRGERERLRHQPADFEESPSTLPCNKRAHSPSPLTDEFSSASRGLEYLSVCLLIWLTQCSPPPHPHPHVCAECEARGRGAASASNSDAVSDKKTRLAGAGGGGVILTTMSFPGVFLRPAKSV